MTPETSSYYSVEGPFDDVAEDLAPALDWWQRVYAVHGRPTDACIGFNQLAGWHARMTLSKISQDQSDMCAVIVGEDVAHAFDGKLAKGVSFSSVIDFNTDAANTYFERLGHEGMISTTVGKRELEDGSAVQINCVNFPLRNSVGEGYSHVVTLYSIRPVDDLNR